ncbi:MAG TPA: lipocalin-like domain-containing protein [Candidatus Competibacter sp.]|nr:lipocalin-like domain-containing protein [Candidatus Competibacter sp.]HUM95563.1 lipocalin-like domain-containing protein [Candidatus Competibacter sp.]
MNPQASTTVSHGLNGLWQLRHMEKTTVQGAVSHPFGAHPLGYLFYSDDGFMFAVLMDRNRAPVKVSLEELGQAKQRKMLWRWKYLKALFRYLQAATACIAYFGLYEVKGDRVIHHVRASLFPDWIGTDLERAFAMSGQAVRLTAHYPNGDRLELAWERA